MGHRMLPIAFSPTDPRACHDNEIWDKIGYNLDFAKAFDKVPHHRLMLKLKAHGIGGKIWN